MKIYTPFIYTIVEARVIVKGMLAIFLACMLIPSYSIAILIHMPFPYILFPPLGKYLLYDYDNYSCTEQSHEVEKCLEMHGIHTYIISGTKLNKTGKIKFTIKNGRISYEIYGFSEGHEWTEIDAGIIKIPFDATLMLPIDPSWFIKYNLITRQEGGWRGHTKLDEYNETEEILYISF